MSSIHGEIGLTRTQRRQLQRLAERVDRVTQTDRRFFERFPHRQHRVRLASRAEIEQHEMLEGHAIWAPDNMRLLVAVRNIVAGVRSRLFLWAPEDAETDLDEVTAAIVYAKVSTPRRREIEEQMRAASEKRG